MGTSSKDAFGAGNGLSHEFGLAMADENVTPQMFKAAIVSNSVRKVSVGAALRGELVVSQITIDQLIAREIALTTAFCETAKIAYPGDALIEKMLRHKESVAEAISINDRFILGGLKRRQLLDVSRSFGINLYNNDPKSADNDGEELPTVQGIFQCDFVTMMVPTNENHHPFMLDYDQRWTWATEQGGHGFSTAEQALYTIIRAKLELGRIPFMGGSFRCKNVYGSGSSLRVGFNADRGLKVSFWGRSIQDWLLGALPWKY
jgi:hypothetical protein